MVCGMTGHKVGTREIPLLGGLAGRMPVYATFMMFGFMASLGLPGLMGFIAEFGLLYGLWTWLSANSLEVLIVFGLLDMMLTAGYYLWAMQKTLFGKTTDKLDFEHCHDIAKNEIAVLAVLCGLIALFGIYPAVAMDFITPYSSVIGQALEALI